MPPVPASTCFKHFLLERKYGTRPKEPHGVCPAPFPAAREGHTRRVSISSALKQTAGGPRAPGRSRQRQRSAGAGTRAAPPSRNASGAAPNSRRCPWERLVQAASDRVAFSARVRILPVPTRFPADIQVAAAYGAGLSLACWDLSLHLASRQLTAVWTRFCPRHSSRRLQGFVTHCPTSHSR